MLRYDMLILLTIDYGLLTIDVLRELTQHVICDVHILWFVLEDPDADVVCCVPPCDSMMHVHNA